MISELVAPDRRVVLHSCCAPCSCAVMEAMAGEGLAVTVLYYNPNIHPRAEYERRKAENARFAERMGFPFVDADYDVKAWFRRIAGLEDAPERGARCARCFDMRMERAALYAHDNGFSVFTTSLGMSRRKSIEQVYTAGHRAASRYDGMRFWDRNWRKGGLADRRDTLVKDEGFYRQTYCGCVFSCRGRDSDTQP